MAKSTTLTVRISGQLSDHLAASVGEMGAYENVSEYVRDLIRRDLAAHDQARFDRLKAELQHAFAAPEETYAPISAAEVIARNARG